MARRRWCRRDPAARGRFSLAGRGWFALAGMVAVAALAGCGEDVQSADLFVLTRTGQGPRLTLLVNDAGTISCNGRDAKPLGDQLLLVARDLATSLDDDAKSGLRINRTPNSVFSYKVRLQDGTIYFPDTAGSSHQELAQAEQFTVQAAHGPCGLT